MRLQITTDDVPERDRFEAWKAHIQHARDLGAAVAGRRRTVSARFSARYSGPLLNCSFDAGFRATRQSREIAHRQWDGYRIYREASAGVWFRIAGQEMVSNTGDLLVADADALFEARPVDRYHDKSWLLPKALLEPHLPRRRAR